jgi:small-conductance mechanosensitive channel
MTSWFEELPWLVPVLRTVLTVGGAYVLGRLATAVLAGRLSRLVRATHGEWDDIFLRAIRPRVPLWSVLAGLWLSLGYWDVPDRWLRIVSGTITTVGFASVTFALAAVASGLVTTYGRQALPGMPMSGLTQNVVRLVIVLLGTLVILNGLGVEIRPMLAALGVGGLAVALALQEPLSNLFAGLFVEMARQVRIGDYVRLDSGIEGRVVDFNWRSTLLELPVGSIAVVPNAKLSQAIVTNFDLPTSELNVPVEIVVDYHSDAATVEQVALGMASEVLRSVEGAVPDFEPLVRFSAFGDIGLRATVVLRARTLSDQALVRHAFITRLHAAFKARGIVIPTTMPLRAPLS